MKCENCGKNEVTFVYQSNINGQFSEKHLCSECAEKMGFTRKAARHFPGMLPGLFNNDPFEEILPSGSMIAAFRRMSQMMLDDPFDDLFAGMPALGTPQAPQEQKQDALLNQDDQNEFARTRQLNALRIEMQQAVQQENFERAAELRDQIRALEAEKQ